MKIISIVGARPQFIKLYSLSKQLRIKCKEIIVHTGQHYDIEMSSKFFEDLGIPSPDYNLGVGSGTHCYQISEIVKRVEKVLVDEKPHLVIVYGDTNSTLAGALAATKLCIPVAHIEAGLRSYNKKMPEEVNRVLTDHCSSFLFCPTENAVKNLQREGFKNIINGGKLINVNQCESSIVDNQLPIVFNVGDTMYDALLMSLKNAEKKSKILKHLNLKSKEYYLATIHRAENTDDIQNLRNIFEALVEISKNMRVIVPLHPRTKKIIDSQNLLTSISYSSLKIIDPVSYFDMLMLEKNANMILTDSGGVQKEAYMLKVPCITLRNETEWVETVEDKWNSLVGTQKESIINAINNFNPIKAQKFAFGDGKASLKIVKILKQLIAD